MRARCYKLSAASATSRPLQHHASTLISACQGAATAACKGLRRFSTGCACQIATAAAASGCDTPVWLLACVSNDPGQWNRPRLRERVPCLRVVHGFDSSQLESAQSQVPIDYCNSRTPNYRAFDHGKQLRQDSQELKRTRETCLSARRRSAQTRQRHFRCRSQARCRSYRTAGWAIRQMWQGRCPGALAVAPGSAAAAAAEAIAGAADCR